MPWYNELRLGNQRTLPLHVLDRDVTSAFGSVAETCLGLGMCLAELCLRRELWSCPEAVSPCVEFPT